MRQRQARERSRPRVLSALRSGASLRQSPGRANTLFNRHPYEYGRSSIADRLPNCAISQRRTGEAPDCCPARPKNRRISSVWRHRCRRICPTFSTVRKSHVWPHFCRLVLAARDIGPLWRKAAYTVKSGQHRITINCLRNPRRSREMAGRVVLKCAAISPAAISRSRTSPGIAKRIGQGRCAGLSK
jgi:hypothetical protein